MLFCNSIDRRLFLKSAGTLFVSSLSEASFARTQQSDCLFASAYKHENGAFGVLIFDEKGQPITNYNLPDRGHDITFANHSGLGVVFARRPGNFAMAFDLKNLTEPQLVTSPKYRHFYGHGVFSNDGKLLYAAENNFDEGLGVIGIYDATNKFNRIGEFSSFGIGPHEILSHPDNNTLIVANGGIETHPDFGRAKLNLATMQPSLCFIDANSGGLLEKHILPDNLHKLSIRHMDVGSNGKVVFGCQYEGAKSDEVPLIGSVSLGSNAKLWELPKEKIDTFLKYVGSVSFAVDQKSVAVTLPKDNQVAILDAVSGDILEVLHQARNFGITAHGNEFITTSELGAISFSRSEVINTNSSISFDNHIAKSINI